MAEDTNKQQQSMDGATPDQNQAGATNPGQEQASEMLPSSPAPATSGEPSDTHGEQTAEPSVEPASSSVPQAIQPEADAVSTPADSTPVSQPAVSSTDVPEASSTSSDLEAKPEPELSSQSSTPSLDTAPATTPPQGQVPTPTSPAPASSTPVSPAPTTLEAEQVPKQPSAAGSTEMFAFLPMEIVLGSLKLSRMMYLGLAAILVLVVATVMAFMPQGGPSSPEGATGEAGQENAAIMTVRQLNPRTGSYSAIIDPLDLASPLELQFDTRLLLPRATPDYRVSRYEWDLNGDGTFSEAEGDSALVTREYRDKGANDGLYEVGVKVYKEILQPHGAYSEVGAVVEETYGPGSARGGFTFKITRERPQIDVRTTPQELDGVAPFEVEFDASRSFAPKGIDEISWDFDGDKVVDEVGDKVTFTFVNPGRQDVTIFITDLEGNTSEEILEVFVDDVLLPDPVINAAPKAGDAPLEVTFDASESSVADGRITAYTWDFGDDSGEVSGEEVNHTYTRAGRFIVTLTTTTDLGTENTAQEVIEVSTSVAAPTARLQAEAEGSDFRTSSARQGGTIRGKVPLSLELNGTVSTDPENDIVNWYWDLDGDGTRDASGGRYTHEYTLPGTYLVTLTVEDSAGNVSQATLTVVAESEEFAVSVLADPVSAVAPAFVAFDASSSSYASGTIASFEWDFGDGSPKRLTSAVVSHQYAAPGEYRAKVTATTTDGKEKTAEVLITMLDQPLVPVITSSLEEAKAPATISFDATESVGAVVSYRWNFGDGNTATGSQVSHTFTTPGRYSVELIVQDERGFQQRALKDVFIQE